MNVRPCQLSIIIPTLDDSGELRELLACLAHQIGVDAEIIICNGGSDTGLSELSTKSGGLGTFPIRVLSSGRGRGIQMNAGAAAANGGTLLFLHADSRFESPDALHRAMAAYKKHCSGSVKPCAARFKLQFRRNSDNPSLAYFYHEAKARLNRGDCIRGDQGYLIEKILFENLGRFDESLSFLEDVRLATLMAAQGEWLLLPDTISTSARRFELEGYYERQVANVIIVNAVETGWDELLGKLPGLYRCNASGRLRLYPLLQGVSSLIHDHDKEWRTRFWNASGRHVATNAWQIFFWLDVRREFSSGGKPDNVQPHWFNFYERHLKTLCNSSPAARTAQFLTRIWLRWMLFSSRRRSPL